MEICFDRAKQNLDELAKIGRNSSGGIDRALGSDEDESARRWLFNYWSDMGLPVKIDAIGNMWVTYKGAAEFAPIVVGSHHDAVKNGGMYDGALGVLLATELVETMQQNGFCPRHDIVIVSFTGEEPNPYQVSTLGSKVATGRISEEVLKTLKNSDTGAPLSEYIRQVGGDLDSAEKARVASGEIGAFIECHIEQGRRLFDEQLPLASVSAITGIYREYIKISGVPNHGGTTKMSDRSDALLAASELNLAFEKIIIETEMDDVVGTIGSLNVFPNSVNIIPGVVDLILEIRTTDTQIKDGIVKKLDAVCEGIKNGRGVQIDRVVNLDQSCIMLDGVVIAAVEQAMTELGVQGPRLVSMAGHDAANMQRVTKSGMLFVSSINGESHCPNESTGDAEIKIAGNALLKTVMILDGVLDSENTI